jgi:hypothetical protein
LRVRISEEFRTNAADGWQRFLGKTRISHLLEFANALHGVSAYRVEANGCCVSADVETTQETTVKCNEGIRTDALVSIRNSLTAERSDQKSVTLT